MDAEKYVLALEKLKGRDRVGIAGEIAATGIGTAAGFAASASVASAFSATTLLGSSTLASVLGGVFVTTTPVGWVIGSAVAAGAVGYGLAKLCCSGGKQDEVRRQATEEMRRRVDQEPSAGSDQCQYDDFITGLQQAVLSRALEPQTADRLIGLVDSSKLSRDVALARVKALLADDRSEGGAP